MNNIKPLKVIHTKTFEKEIKFFLYLILFLLVGYIVLDKVILDRLKDDQSTKIEEKV